MSDGLDEAVGYCTDHPQDVVASPLLTHRECASGILTLWRSLDPA